MINIREANADDLPTILRLYSAREIDNGKVLDLDTAKRYFAEVQAVPDYKIYLCFVDGIPVGTFSLAILRNLAHMGKKSGIIEDVVVSEEHRSKGIGSGMMRYAIALCRGEDCYKVSLSSNLKRERAHRFYEKLGFMKHGFSFSMNLENSDEG